MQSTCVVQCGIDLRKQIHKQCLQKCADAAVQMGIDLDNCSSRLLELLCIPCFAGGWGLAECCVAVGALATTTALLRRARPALPGLLPDTNTQAVEKFFTRTVDAAGAVWPLDLCRQWLVALRWHTAVTAVRFDQHVLDYCLTQQM